MAMKFIATWALGLAALNAGAQTAHSPVPQNVLQLSASGAVEVQQDLLVMTLRTVREGADAASVQTQLSVVLDGALAEAKKTAQPGMMDVRTGNFSLYPRHTREGKISGWQGSAELVLEGKDFARISATAGKLTGLTVGNVGFNLSPTQRAKVETEAQMHAIEGFRAKATQLARGFGFSGYTLREVAVDGSSSMEGGPRPMLMQAKAASADAPVPVEPGKSTVVVTVSGTVQLK